MSEHQHLYSPEAVERERLPLDPFRRKPGFVPKEDFYNDKSHRHEETQRAVIGPAYAFDRYLNRPHGRKEIQESIDAVKLIDEAGAAF